MELAMLGDPWREDERYPSNHDPKQRKRFDRAVKAAQRRDWPERKRPQGYHYAQDMKPYLVWKATQKEQHGTL
jgi:hypothetical protein